MTLVKFLPISATILDHMGSDKTVVDAARVSFAKFGSLGFGMGDINASDANLINYLASGMQTAQRKALIERIQKCQSIEEAEAAIRDIRAIAEHWTPFGHCMATFHVRAPIFVHRQVTRSTAGFVINEESRRYIDHEPNFFRPIWWRGRPVDKKQGSGANLEMHEQSLLNTSIADNTTETLYRYNHALKQGAAPEQARMFLPLNTHTEWVWTGSLYAWARVANLRLAGDAQQESGDLARQISDQMAVRFPLSWRALSRYAE